MTTASVGTSVASTGAAPADVWPTYHRDLARTGNDPNLPAFKSLRRAWQSDQLDGAVYAEPLFADGRLLVATENNSLYALDPATGHVLWRTHLGDPVPRSALPCGNIDSTGITSTPVVDVANKRLYAVDFLQPGRHELVAVDLASGSVRYRQAIDPAGANPITQQQRSALALSRGTIYIAFGGLFGDCGQYHGWLVGASAVDGVTRFSYQVPTQREGAIWAPSGPAIDANGDVFVTTGNGSSRSDFDFGNAVVRLTADLKVLDWFAPTNWLQLNNTDQDLGSVGPALLDGGLIFQIGKQGTGYLLNVDHLGNIGGQAFTAPVCNGAFGGTAYAPPYVYIPCRRALVAVKVESGPRFTVAWQSDAFTADSPIVAGGVVWSVDQGARTLYGLDPQSGQILLRGSIAVGSDTLPHFITPTAADGRIFVSSGSHIVAFTSS